jgi:hypothetical protein
MEREKDGKRNARKNVKLCSFGSEVLYEEERVGEGKCEHISF